MRKEIDAHIADRLLEAVWREGLWLIHDDVATTAEVDDAIRFGFGLRWAQMGLFETYRIAGGEAGMRHFIGQFGPALAWPWTKLMDVPELTEALVEKIASQSDAQSGARSIRELERIRDDNLVGILQALKATGWGAGETLRAMEDRAYARAHAGAGAARPDPTRPLTLHRAQVRGDWVDYNGHMTEFRYLQVFGDATDAFLALIGMDAAYRAAGGSVYTVETHIRHRREAKAGAKLARGHAAPRPRRQAHPPHACADRRGRDRARHRRAYAAARGRQGGPRDADGSTARRAGRRDLARTEVPAAPRPCRARHPRNRLNGKESVRMGPLPRMILQRLALGLLTLFVISLIIFLARRAPARRPRPGDARPGRHPRDARGAPPRSSGSTCRPGSATSTGSAACCRATSACRSPTAGRSPS